MPTRIAGLGHYLPERQVKSTEVERRVAACSPGFRIRSGLIERLSGVRSRHVQAIGESCSRMAAKASERALLQAGLDPLDVDLLLFAGASAEVLEPATAPIVQAELGATNANCIDVRDACNGFLRAIDVAMAYLETGRAKTAVVAAGEIGSRFANYVIHDAEDLALKFAALTLGDGAGAMVLTPSHESAGRLVARGRYMTDGRHWETSVVRLFDDQKPVVPYFECHGSELAKVATSYLPSLVKESLDQMGWSPGDVALVVPHQVTSSFGDFIAASMGFERERVFMVLQETGNVAAASVPIALSTAAEQGRLKTGDKVLLVVAAGGVSAGVVPIEW